VYKSILKHTCLHLIYLFVSLVNQLKRLQFASGDQPYSCFSSLMNLNLMDCAMVACSAFVAVRAVFVMAVVFLEVLASSGVVAKFAESCVEAGVATAAVELVVRLVVG